MTGMGCCLMCCLQMKNLLPQMAIHILSSGLNSLLNSFTSSKFTTGWYRMLPPITLCITTMQKLPTKGGLLGLNLQLLLCHPT